MKAQITKQFLILLIWRQMQKDRIKLKGSLILGANKQDKLNQSSLLKWQKRFYKKLKLRLQHGLKQVQEQKQHLCHLFNHLLEIMIIINSLNSNSSSLRQMKMRGEMQLEKKGQEICLLRKQKKMISNGQITKMRMHK